MRGRPRHQTGHVTPQGLNWRGEYYQSLVQEDGRVKRVHRSIVLGQRSEIRETDARRKLAEVIAKETQVRPDNGAVHFLLSSEYPTQKLRTDNPRIKLSPLDLTYLLALDPQNKGSDFIRGFERREA